MSDEGFSILFSTTLLPPFSASTTLVIFEFDMVDVTNNTENEYVQQFPGSKIWERSTLFLRLFRFTYPAIQIIDGNGQKIDPAFSEWQSSTETNFIIGLREDGIDDLLVC